VKKILVLVFAVLALSGCWITAGQVILDSRILDMKLPKQQEPPPKQCSPEPCQTFCLNTLDDCNKQAKALCEGGDFEVVDHKVSHKTNNNLFFSCK